MGFEFVTAARIIFGVGAAQQLGKLAADFGQQALIVTGSQSQRHAALLELLDKAGVHYSTFAITSEPDIVTIERGVAQARQEQAALVIAIGGGSVIDAGKALAALATNQGQPFDYLEVVGAGKPLINDPLPFIAVPTTAGTGAEVTKNAVLAVPEKRVKVSLRDGRMLPKIALIDPQLTLDLPPELTATTGLDALTQLIEPFTSPLANPLTDALCRDGIPRAARALRKVYHQPQDLEARHDMMLASLLGGLALANAKLGAVHGFAGVLGGQTGAPHGAICGSLLPHVTAANIAALAESDPHGTLERYCEVAVMLTGRTDAQPRDAVGWLEAIAAELNIPALGILGLTRDVIPAVAQQSAQASSMKGNPVVFDQAQLIQILERAL